MTWDRAGGIRGKEKKKKEGERKAVKGNK